ncbi:MAG: prepilin-type N-terminal cleavage/methylation domain-containing protein [Planctomycetota bacterium]|nr:prepilin-type N-terminal cleavage/methylation domain-containing protein [Planctomycetota bacterium]
MNAQLDLGRRGGVLLEMIIAVSLFAMAALTLAGAMERSLTRAREALDADRAGDLARSALAMLESGLATPESLHGEVSPGRAVLGLAASEEEIDAYESGLATPQAAWELVITTEPTAHASLTRVSVTARLVPLGASAGGSGLAGGGGGVIGSGASRASVTLHQLMSLFGQSEAELGADSDASSSDGSRADSSQTPDRVALGGSSRTRSTRPRPTRLRSAQPRTERTHAARVMMARRRGLTLIEVLVAIGLLLALSASMYAMLAGLEQRRGRVVEQVRRGGGINVFLDRIERELLTCVASHQGKPGVRGSSTSLELASAGVSGRSASQVTQFSFENGAARIGRENEAAEDVAPLASGRFRYYDGRSWSDSFNSVEANALPVAIEVAAWFERGPAAEGELGGAGLSTEPQSGANDTKRQEADDGERDRSVSETGEVIAPSRVRVMSIPDGPVADRSVRR